MDGAIEEGGCGTISPLVLHSLKIETVPPCDIVIKHLQQISSRVCNEDFIDWVEEACEHIYKYFEVMLSTGRMKPHDLESLKCEKSVWTGTKFVFPKCISRSWNSQGPFLYRIPHLLVSKENLVNALNIAHSFGVSHYITALKQIKEDNVDTGIGNKHELKTIIEIARELSEEMGEHSCKELQETCYLPDTLGIMRESTNLYFNDTPWCESDVERYFVYHHISRSVAVKLGVTPMRSVALKEHEHPAQHWEVAPFGPHETLILRIQNILRDYPQDATILKELLQNADDAKATKMYIILDKRTHAKQKVPFINAVDLQGPALLVWNDSGFTENDLSGIQKLGLGSKRSDAESIGQYGIGFNVVYHITDCPSFFTNGNTLCVFDPQCRYVQ